MYFGFHEEVTVGNDEEKDGHDEESQVVLPKVPSSLVSDALSSQIVRANVRYSEKSGSSVWKRSSSL